MIRSDLTVDAMTLSVVISERYNHRPPENVSSDPTTHHREVELVQITGTVHVVGLDKRPRDLTRDMYSMYSSSSTSRVVGIANNGFTMVRLHK
jgi:hypothetical protein